MTPPKDPKMCPRCRSWWLDERVHICGSTAESQNTTTSVSGKTSLRNEIERLEAENAALRSHVAQLRKLLESIFEAYDNDGYWSEQIKVLDDAIMAARSASSMTGTDESYILSAEEADKITDYDDFVWPSSENGGENVSR